MSLPRRKETENFLMEELKKFVAYEFNKMSNILRKGIDERFGERRTETSFRSRPARRAFRDSDEEARVDFEELKAFAAKEFEKIKMARQGRFVSSKVDRNPQQTEPIARIETKAVEKADPKGEVAIPEGLQEILPTRDCELKEEIATIPSMEAVYIERGGAGKGETYQMVCAGSRLSLDWRL